MASPMIARNLLHDLRVSIKKLSTLNLQRAGASTFENAQAIPAALPKIDDKIFAKDSRKTSVIDRAWLYLFIRGFLARAFDFQKISGQRFRICPDMRSKKCIARMWLLATLILIGESAGILFRGQDIPHSAQEFFTSIYNLMAMSLVIAAIWPQDKNKGFFTRVFGTSFLVFIIAIDSIGYHRLSSYLTQGIILSTLSIIVVASLAYLLDYLTSLLDKKRTLISEMLYEFLLVKPHRNITGLLLLRIAFAIASILILVGSLFYSWELGFAFALLFSMLVAGADFTGLAIIIGALSVGIGLGLQGVVNNFISGLILLVEKPIKPGDRIRVGTTEGFVKKVRIRSTQISTMAKDVNQKYKIISDTNFAIDNAFRQNDITIAFPQLDVHIGK